MEAVADPLRNPCSLQSLNGYLARKEFGEELPSGIETILKDGKVPPESFFTLVYFPPKSMMGAPAEPTPPRNPCQGYEDPIFMEKCEEDMDCFCGEGECLHVKSTGSSF